MAIAVGTVVQAIAFAALLFGVISSVSEELAEPGGPSLALGFILVPVTAALVAFISGHERAPMATVKAMGIWVLLALPLAIVNPITGFSTGFAAAGAFSLKSDATRPGKARAIAVVVLAAYVTILALILPQAAVLAGAISPLLAIRGADIYSERSATP